jgi:hypothetical protein
MGIENKIFYNEASAAKMGWSPDWFDCEEFDEDLIEAITAWQEKNGLTADGLFGPASFRRLYNERISEIDVYAREETESCSGNSIIYNGEPYAIEWDKVVLWTEPRGLKAEKGNYSDYTGKPKRDVKMFVVHWDVCTSSKTCQRVLNKRGISVTFLISADGTVFQTCDMQHATWHAGGRKWNHSSTGVEINNAYYPKWGSWYVRHGFGERPVWNGKVHGTTLKNHLGFYPVQVEALKALVKAISIATGMPLDTPDTDTVYKPATRCEYSGVVHHFQLKRGKIDSAGLDLVKMIGEIKDAT